MPPDTTTDLVTYGSKQEKGSSEGIYVRFAGTTRPTKMLHERVQAAKDAYIEYETVNLGIPGGDPSRWRLKPFINECFAHMSNALTHIDHIRGSGDVVAAADEMDKYQFHLRLIRHNNATRFTEDETEAGFHPEPKDSLTGIKDAVQTSLRSLELEVKRGCLEYWGSQLSPQRVPRSGKIKDGTLEDGELEEEEQGWKSIEDFRHAVASKWHRASEGQESLT